MKITKDMTIGEVMRNYPEAADVFMKHGLKCIGCMMALMETIEQGAKSHGIDLEKLLKELNEAVETKRKETKSQDFETSGEESGVSTLETKSQDFEKK